MTEPYYCTFCAKSQHDVRQLIAGPGTVFICDECVEICADIVREKREREAKAASLPLFEASKRED